MLIGIPAAQFPIQLPVYMLRKAVENGNSVGAPEPMRKDSEKDQGFWLQTGPALVVGLSLKAVNP